MTFFASIVLLNRKKMIIILLLLDISVLLVYKAGKLMLFWITDLVANETVLRRRRSETLEYIIGS